MAANLAHRSVWRFQVRRAVGVASTVIFLSWPTSLLRFPGAGLAASAPDQRCRNDSPAGPRQPIAPQSIKADPPVQGDGRGENALHLLEMCPVGHRQGWRGAVGHL